MSDRVPTFNHKILIDIVRGCAAPKQIDKKRSEATLASMLTTLVRPAAGSSAKWCGLLWKTLTPTQCSPATHAYCQQVKRRGHYLRSPYSIIRHHFKGKHTLEEAKNFVANFPKVRSVARSQLDHTLRLIKDDGYSWEEVELCRDVMLLSPAQYSRRVQLLQHFSISEPTLYLIYWMITLMDCPIASLSKKFGHILTSDPVEHLLKAGSSDLSLPDPTMQGARDLSCRDDQVTVKHVFLYMIKHYLALRFPEDTDIVGSSLDAIPLGIFLRPLHQYPGICDVLINHLQFSFSEIREQPRLLNIDPVNTKEIVKRFPVIGGTPIREVAKAFPKLLLIPAYHLECWLNLLNKYQVEKFMYTQHTTTLFNSSLFTKVDEKLRILSQLPAWEIIAVSDKLFEILRSHRSIKMLLNTTESGQVVSSLYSAINAMGHSRRRQWRRVTPEIVTYVASTLDLAVEEVREVLTEDIYTPFGITNTKTVLRLLLDYGFTREQVIAGAMLLNLEAGVVEQALKDLHARPEAQPFAEWMENPFILHLLAYCIKKDIPHLDLPVKNIRT
ncbi:hypothetical protein GWK47_031699 [Chionoecetes opilio]|uniref:Uncharacterized protein n=1 Tax=Chionoecetes opilio TaxID=41210 RepID=A0A8J4YK92_CHIOP|nr:hypothetical protein GWK47_031699 [Chionoecetes opilio]